MLRLLPPKFDFLTFEELGRLLEAVKDDGERGAMFLLGAEAGLRMGEIIALEWGDVDFVAGKITVRRAEWNGLVDSPKGGKDRPIPMTPRLAAALRAHRHQRSDRVFCRADGRPMTQSVSEAGLRYAYKRAGLPSERLLNACAR